MSKKSSSCSPLLPGSKIGFFSVGLDENLRPTPSGNTGLDSQEDSVGTSIDWLSICWDGSGYDRHGKVSRMEKLLDLHFGIVFDFSQSIARTRGHAWSHGYRGSFGADYLLNYRDGLTTQHRISLPGGVVGNHPASKVLNFCREFLVAHPGARITRLDFAIDDYGFRLNPSDLIQAYRLKQHHGFVEGQFVGDMGLGLDIDSGWTLGFGSRKSDKYYRYYNKKIESKGQLPSYRLELESKGRRASTIFDGIIKLSGSREIHNYILDVVTGGIDFLEGGDKNLSRQNRLGFWAEWLRSIHAAPLRISVLPIENSILRKINWLERQASGALYLIVEALGLAAFIRWLSDTIHSSFQLDRRDTPYLLSEFWRQFGVLT